jgi:hypothetical protein
VQNGRFRVTLRERPFSLRLPMLVQLHMQLALRRTVWRLSHWYTSGNDSKNAMT